jgi:hypothetical protein
VLALLVLVQLPGQLQLALLALAQALAVPLLESQPGQTQQWWSREPFLVTLPC